MAEDLKIDIKSSADTAGLDKAAAALQGVDKAGAGAQKTLVNSSQGFSAASAAASAANGSVQGVAAALGQLAPKLQALNAALPVIGLLMAAFTAWKKVIDTVTESQRAQEAGLRAITSGNIAAGIDTVAASYDRLRQSIDEAKQAQDDMLAGERAMAAARRDRELAEIELGKQQALAGEADPLKRRAIEADAAARAAGVQSAFGAGDEARTAAALAGRRDAAQASAQAAGTQEEVLGRKLAQALQEQQRVADIQRKAIDSAWTSLGKDKAGERYDQEIAGLGASIGQLGADLKAARDERIAAEAEVRRAEADIAANAVASGARGIGRQAAAVAAGAGVSQAQADIDKRAAAQRQAEEDAARKEAALAAAQAEAQAQQERLDALARTARREQAESDAASVALGSAEAANVRRARPDRDRVLAPYREAAGREEAEARQANAAFASARSELGAMLRQLTGDIKQLESEVKQARTRAGRAAVDVEAGG